MRVMYRWFQRRGDLFKTPLAFGRASLLQRRPINIRLLLVVDQGDGSPDITGHKEEDAVQQAS